MRYLVTGNAGFIGFHLARVLLERGQSVVGLDVVNDYYEVTLKEQRLARLEETAKTSTGDYAFVRADLADNRAVQGVFEEHKPSVVVNLAAQAGVRYSLENPHAYVHSNLTGFTNILEGCRHHGVEHLVYASTSSVYGANTDLPFSEHKGANHPLQFYAATKKANEMMAHSYSHLFGLPTTGLRFFTVYGPWGRPDMALFLFTSKILAGEPIQVFNNGRHTRDFTYVDDIVEAITRISDKPATADPGWKSDDPDPASSNAPFRLYNIGNSSPVELLAYVRAIELAAGKKAEIEFLPLQSGDVPDTFADTTDLSQATGFTPATSVEDGVGRFVEWYRSYHGV
ncbi:MAG: NAD-dependent epimerase [Roseitalea sp.]|nr:NAD-dependent epimerase [Roseitalea sp.]MBO6950920.1 NAD-dependent epimerase [Rhizobiaceae bacterium]MBO6591093.1 NAD-dependent epimerase [Roseitalea sp.]MBO6599649.1 NAD-dependent epimerase [Roseitalea sp.]MBO6613900.1 NAD-dependent epimerase [Roseitalea sp.]